MDLIQLKAFTLAAQYRNLSQVAVHMYISQSSISKYIASLESELGIPLFNRFSRGLELTQFGQNFLPYAQSILGAETEAMEFVLSQQCSGTSLNIGLVEELKDGSNIGFFRAYVNALHEFTNLYPGIYVNCNFYPHFELFGLLRNAKIDAAIIPVCDKHFDSSQNNVVRHYILQHIGHFLTVNPALSHCGTLEELSRNLKTIYYLPNQVNNDILNSLLNEMAFTPRCVACDSSMDLFLKVSTGGYYSASLIQDHTMPMIRDMGISFFDLKQVGLNSTLYFVSERKNISPYIQPFSELMKKYLEVEDAILRKDNFDYSDFLKTYERAMQNEDA